MIWCTELVTTKIGFKSLFFQSIKICVRMKHPWMVSIHGSTNKPKLFENSQFYLYENDIQHKNSTLGHSKTM